MENTMTTREEAISMAAEWLREEVENRKKSDGDAWFWQGDREEMRKTFGLTTKAAIAEATRRVSREVDLDWRGANGPKMTALIGLIRRYGQDSKDIVRDEFRKLYGTEINPPMFGAARRRINGEKYGAEDKGDHGEGGGTVPTIPEFEEVTRIITRYKTLIDKQALLQEELRKVEKEMDSMRPIVEGFEIMKRKTAEYKDSLRANGF